MIFNFFLKSYRHGILTFSGGQDFEVIYDPNGLDGKECFKHFEDGSFKSPDPSKLPVIRTKHPNIVYGVIKGKKSWGLWKGEWVDGIVEWSFTREEILSQFTDIGIVIPESFIIEFDNLFEKRKVKRYL